MPKGSRWGSSETQTGVGTKRKREGAAVEIPLDRTKSARGVDNRPAWATSGSAEAVPARFDSSDGESSDSDSETDDDLSRAERKRRKKEKKRAKKERKREKKRRKKEKKRAKKEKKRAKKEREKSGLAKKDT